MKLGIYFDVNPTGNTHDFGDYITYIDTSSVKNGELLEVQLLEKEYPSRAKRKILGNDILYSSVRPILRHYYYYTDTYEHAVASTGFFLIRSKHANNKYRSKFVYYYLSTNSIVEYLNNIAESSQTTFPSCSDRDVLKITLPDFSLKHQDMIITILSQYDNLISINKKRIKLLEETAQQLYQEWFVRFRFPGYEKTKFVDGIPLGWEYVRLSEVLSLLDSKRIPLSSMERDRMERNYPYYGAAGQLGFVEDFIFDGTYLLLGEDGSVITADGHPYLQYVWGKFWVNNHAHIIEQRGNYSVEFLYCMFKKMNVQSIVTGVAQPKISQGRLFMKKVLLPSDIVLKAFNEKIQPLFSQIKVLTEQNKNLTKQRDLLLPRLMSGKLAV